MTYSLVGRKLGESSLFLRMSLHLLTVSKRRNVSPTENSVDKQLASSFRVGGPGAPWMCVVNCSTNFFWHAFISDWKMMQKMNSIFFGAPHFIRINVDIRAKASLQIRTTTFQIAFVRIHSRWFEKSHLVFLIWHARNGLKRNTQNRSHLLVNRMVFFFVHNTMKASRYAVPTRISPVSAEMTFFVLFLVRVENSK